MKKIIEQCCKIAEETGVFKPEEIDVLDELLVDAFENKNTTYRYDDIKIGDEIAGFVIYGKTPMTDFGYDLYWVVVSPKFQWRGLALQLIQKMEANIVKESVRGVVRIETSSMDIYAPARKLYLKAGY